MHAKPPPHSFWLEEIGRQDKEVKGKRAAIVLLFGKGASLPK
jgi:hypothetical protein